MLSLLVSSAIHAQLILQPNVVPGFPANNSINTVYFSSLSPSDKNLAKSGIIINHGNYLVMDEDLDMNTNSEITVHDAWGGVYVNSQIAGRIALQSRIFCSRGTWKGIVVNGEGYQPHFIIPPDESILNDQQSYMGAVNSYHGIVDIQTGSIIENAEHGVWSKDGGIIQSFIDADDPSAKFIDCQEGICIENSIHSPSATRINKCDFSWTDPGIHGLNDYQNFVHVTIRESQDIRLEGCEIVGEYGLGRTYDTDAKGIGILVIGAETTFSLGEAGNTFASAPGTGCLTVKYESDPSNAYLNVLAQLSTGIDVLACDEGAINNTFFVANITGARVVGKFVDFHDNIFRAKDDWLIQSFNPSPSVGSKLCIDLASVTSASIYRNIFNYHNFNFPNSPWPAVAMISVNGFRGGDIKVIDNIFNGNVDNTIETQFAIAGGGDLQNFEWTCNEFNDFETAVTYSGSGPAQNPISGNNANNTYNNISSNWVINNSSGVVNYIGVNSNVVALNSILVDDGGSGEFNDCAVNCTAVQTKYKRSPTASIAPILSKGEIAVYPNPTTGAITLDFGKGKSGQMTIYNAQGQQVTQATVQSGVQYTEGSLLPAGLYFVEVLAGETKSTAKLIIAR